MPGTAVALREEVRILLAPRGHQRYPEPARGGGRELRASSVTAPWAACSSPIRPPPESHRPDRWALPFLRPTAAGAKLCRRPASPRLELPRPPPGPRLAGASSCLPETCPAVCARVCVSKRIASPPSLGCAGGTGPRRPAAEWLPVHTLPALSPPTPPLLLALPSFPCSSFSCRSRSPKESLETTAKGRRRVGKEAQVSLEERWARAQRLAVGGRPSIDIEGEGKGVAGRIYPKEKVRWLSHRASDSDAGTAGQAARWSCRVGDIGLGH